MSHVVSQCGLTVDSSTLYLRIFDAHWPIVTVEMNPSFLPSRALRFLARFVILLFFCSRGFSIVAANQL